MLSCAKAPVGGMSGMCALFLDESGEVNGSLGRKNYQRYGVTRASDVRRSQVVSNDKPLPEVFGCGLTLLAQRH